MTGEAVDLPAPSREVVLRELLDPYDVEDLVFTYLQVERNYVVLPKSRRTDNRTYEWALMSTAELPVLIETGIS